MLHNAIVRWCSPAKRGKRQLPPTLLYRGLSRFSDAFSGDSEDAWSVELRFDVPPPEQPDLNSSLGRIRFLVDDAPHERLRPGVTFELFEGPFHVADVEVLD